MFFYYISFFKPQSILQSFSSNSFYMSQNSGKQFSRDTSLGSCKAFSAFILFVSIKAFLGESACAKHQAALLKPDLSPVWGSPFALEFLWHFAHLCQKMPSTFFKDYIFLA